MAFADVQHVQACQQVHAGSRALAREVDAIAGVQALRHPQAVQAGHARLVGGDALERHRHPGKPGEQGAVPYCQQHREYTEQD